MPSQLEYVQAQVMQLAPAERTQLLERLLSSLDTNPEPEAESEQQADQSQGDLEAGLPQPLPDEENQMAPVTGIDVYFTQPTPHTT